FLVWGDRRALHADAVAFDRVGGVDRHLVGGAVAVLDGEVVVLEVDVEIGEDQSFSDETPHNAGHFIAVELDDRVRDLDLRHGAPRHRYRAGRSRSRGGRRRCATKPGDQRRARRLPPRPQRAGEPKYTW